MHRDPGQLLDDLPSDQSGMPRGPTGDDVDPPQRRAVGRRQVETVEARNAPVTHEPAAQRAAHRLRLLQDLLLHEVRMAAQLDRFEVPAKRVHRSLLHLRGAVDHPVAGRREDSDVSVVQVHDRAGVLENG